MDKQHFLDELRTGLNFLSPAELNEVMDEFNEHFTSGIQQGKTEQQLIDQLGDPKRIIESYRNDALNRAEPYIEPCKPDDTQKTTQRDEEPSKNQRSKGFGRSFSTYISIHERFKASDVLAIDVRTTDSEIKFTLGDEPEVRVDIEGTSGCDIYAELRNGKLQVVQEFHIFRLFHWHSEPDIRITLPRVFEGSLDIETAAGEVELPGFKGYSLKVKTVAGDLELGDLYATHSLAFHTVSGDIEVGKTMAESISIHSTAGDIEMGTLTSSRLNIETVSGDIEQKGHSVWEAVEMRVKTVSGDINVALNDYWKTLNFITISGDIDLMLPDDCKPFQIQLESVSGEVKNPFGTSPNADRLIKAKTVSGDLHIRRG